MTDTPALNPLRQVDFYRERSTMCGGDLITAAEQIEYLLRLMFGDLSPQAVTPEQLVHTAKALRQRMRRCSLLLLKHDLVQGTYDAIDGMTDEEIDALPPLPEDTIFAFEEPTIFDLPPKPGTEHHDCTEGECEHAITGMLMSIVVPISSTELLFDESEPMPAFAGYSRLDNQRTLAAHDTDPRAEYMIEELERHDQVWIPTLFYPMGQALHGRVSMERLLKSALHRATRPVNTTPPRSAQRDAADAQVRPKAARAVRTVELAPRYRTTGTGTGTPLRWQTRTTGHWRHYRDTEGNVRKRVWIDSYIRGADKPPRPPHQRPGAVTVAREPRPDTDHREEHQ